METLRRYRPAAGILLLVALLCVPALAAHAEMSTGDLTNAILHKYEAAMSRWEEPIHAEAMWVFWRLAVITLVLRMTAVLLSDGRLPGFTSALVWFAIGQGFWHWVLDSGPEFFQGIVKGLWTLGGQAAGVEDGLSVSAVLNLGMKLYQLDGGLNDWLNLGNSMMAAFMGVVALAVAAVMAANIMTTMIGASVTAYAGQIVLALGGLDYTRDIAAGYLRMVLAMGLRAMSLALIMGLGLNIENDILAMAGNAPSIGEIGLLTMGLIILLFLALIIPHHVAHLAGGGGGFFGGALGLGSAWMAAQIAGRVVSELRASGGGHSGEGAAEAVRKALEARDGVMSVEEAARHGERLAAQGVRPTRNGNKE